MRAVADTLRIGDLLDRRFAYLRGAMETPKSATVCALARVLDAAGVRYALIGGVAVQVWAEEPRTTLDVDIAVRSYDDLPRAELERAGFVRGARHEHSENWTGPSGSPVQFSDDPQFAPAIAAAVVTDLDGTPLCVAPVVELIRAKLRAARDPARRRSKRLQDRADAVALGEQYPDVLPLLDARDRADLDA